MTYTTQAGDEDWPWTGLSLTVLSPSLTARLQPGAVFVDATATAGLALGASERGVCMADFDSDGDQDVFVGDPGGGVLWVQTAPSFFEDQTSAMGIGSGESFGCAWGDFSGDGILDLFVTDEEVASDLYVAEGGAFADRSAQWGVPDAGVGTRGVTVGDLNGDDTLDLVMWSSTSDVNVLLTTNGAAFTPAAGAIPQTTPHLRQIVMFDVNGDDALDALLCSRTAPNALFLNSGTASFTDITSFSGAGDGGHCIALAVGDLDNSGSLDVYVSNEAGDSDALLLAVGDGTFTVADPTPTADAASYGVAVVDLDLDGDLDLVVGTAAALPVAVLLSDGAGTFRSAGAALGFAATDTVLGMAWGDVDGDGDVDGALFSGQQFYVSANSPSNTWLSLEVHTPSGAPSVFGATARLEAVSGGAWVSARVVDGGSGMASQNAYPAHFAVPDAGSVYNASIRWPTGAASHATHPFLGSITPAALSLSRRRIVVRTLQWSAAVTPVSAVDSGTTPQAGVTTVTLTLVTSPPIAGFFVLPGTPATVNGFDVSTAFVETAPGTATLTYTTQGGDTAWPWTGLHVDVTLADTGGLRHHVNTVLTPGSTFVKDATARGMTASAGARSACVADFSNDGFPDVLLAVRNADNLFWVSSPDGASYTNRAVEWDVEASAFDNSFGCAVGDYSGDGLLDVFITIEDSKSPQLYRNTGSESFSVVSASAGVSVARAATGAAWGDVDGDGHLDLYVGIAASSNVLYHNNGDGTLDEAASGGGSAAAVTRAVALFDCDDDSDLDAFVANSNVANALFINTGAGSFLEDTANTRGLGDTPLSHSFAVVDADGDGALDVYVTGTNDDVLYINSGVCTFSPVAPPNGVASTHVSAGDFNLDGHADFLLSPGVLLRGDAPTYTDVAAHMGPLESFTLAIFLDADNDGDVDALFPNTGELFVNTNAHPSAHNWITVTPLTPVGAPSLVGATVRVVCVQDCLEPWQAARVCGVSGVGMSQAAYSAHFGLPWSFAGYNITVRAPGAVFDASTHPALGVFVPQAVPGPRRHIVLSQVAFAASLQQPPLWDRSTAPTLSDSATLTFSVSPPTPGLFAIGTVNGVDIADSLSESSDGAVYTLEYTTQAGGDPWPWAGLDVQVTLSDTGGVFATVSELVVPGTAFEDRTAALLPTAVASAARGICVEDFDLDGDVDFFVSVDGGPEQLWVFHDSTFTNEASTYGMAGSNEASGGCGWADVNDDGFPELFVARRQSTPDLFFVSDGAGGLAPDSASGLGGTQTSYDGAWGDVDGDGRSDLMVAVWGAPSHLYMNNGDGSFTDDGPNRGLAALGLYTAVALGDVTHDGHLDAFLVGNSVDVFYGVNNGAGVFLPQGTTRGLPSVATAPPTSGVAISDLDADGDFDLIVTFEGSRPYFAYNDGDGDFTVVTSVVPSSAQMFGVAFLDFELDGDLDVALGRVSGADVFLRYHPSADALSWWGTDVGFADGNPTYPVAVGDLDADGDMDVFVSSSSALKVIANTNARPDLHRWVTLVPLSRSGSPAATGAVARAVCVSGCTPAWQAVRSVGGGSGYRCQNAYGAHFGLPSTTAAYNMSVQWPGEGSPSATHDTHPGLGNFVPAHATTEALTVVVRLQPVEVVATVDAWPHDSLAPTEGAPVTVRVVTFPGAAADLVAATAEVAGQDVATSFMHVGGGEYTLTVSAPSPTWPWDGLAPVSIVVVDSAGLVSAVAPTALRPGSTLDTSPAFPAFPSPSRSSCVADVDGDTDIDVFLGGSPYLFINDGSGVFEEDTAGRGIPAADTRTSCAFADTDDDGDMDLFVGQSGSVVLLVNNGAGVFADKGGVAATTPAAFGAAFVDLDGDGSLDMLTCAAALHLHLNDGAGVFTTVDGSWGIVAADCVQAVAFDFSGDGVVDVLTTNSQQLVAYVRTGVSLFTDETSSRVVGSCGGGLSVAVGDMNNDGALDVVLGGPECLLVNDGSGVFSAVAPRHSGLFALSSEEVYGSAVLDVDLDGDMDIVTGNSLAATPLHVWLNDGTGSFVSSAAAVGLDSHLIVSIGVSAVDLDGDGDEDLVMDDSSVWLRSTVAAPGRPGPLRVRPLSASGAMSAFGALVHVACVSDCSSPWASARLISSASGRQSQPGYDAVFGLLTPSAWHNVTVSWPDGAVSSWATHPRLGRVSTAAVLVVRPAPLTASVGIVLPWDVAASSRPQPEVGDTVVVPITLHPPVALSDVAVVAFAVNTQGLSNAAVATADGFAVTYTTTGGFEAWPWSGLHVTATVVDGGGLLSTVEGTVVVGAAAEDVSTSSGFGAAHGDRCMCAGDLNDDGVPDVYVGTNVGGHKLWLSVNATVVYSQVAPAWNLTDGPNSSGNRACTFADFNGDSHLDLMVGNYGATNFFFVNTGNGSFVEDGVSRGANIGGSTGGLTLLDVDADGDVDVFLSQYAATNVLLVNDGTGVFSRGEAAWGLDGSVNPVSSSIAVVAFDATGNGWPDLFVSFFLSGAVAELLVGTGGPYVEDAAGRGADVRGTITGLAVGDFDSNGFPDVVAVQWTNSPTVLLNDGSGHFTQVTLASSPSAAASRSAAALDWDLDGMEDVFEGVESSGSDGLFLQAEANFTSVAPMVLGGDLEAATLATLTLDLDSDGDLDLVTIVSGRTLLNHNARPAAPTWLTVRPLNRLQAPSAFGATVRVACSSPACGDWHGVRAVYGASGYSAQQPYGVHFGLPASGATYDVEVLFPGGALHNRTTQAALGGVLPGTHLDVIDRPYTTVSVAPTTGWATPSSTVSIMLRSAGGLTGLVPAPQCCFVNGVQVGATFAEDGGGVYSLSYVVAESHASWPADGLRVTAPLMAADTLLGSDVVEVTAVPSLAGDTQPPTIRLDVAPGAVSASAFETVEASCPTEAACDLFFTLTVNGGVVVGDLTPTNSSAPAAGRVLVSRLSDEDEVALQLVSFDAAGNNATAVVAWVVDTSSPVTQLLTKPVDVAGQPTSRKDATFDLGCSEAVCRFEYSLNGGPPTPLGGNDTQSGAAAAEVETVVVLAPARVSASASPVFVFAVNMSTPAMLVNASVEVSVDGGAATRVPVSNGNQTQEWAPPVPGDGVYVLEARGVAGDGTTDVSPLTFAFTVDTLAPTTRFVQVPTDGDPEASPVVAFSASEPDCVYWWRAGPAHAYALHNTSWAASSVGVVALSNATADVRHAVEVFAVDVAGNTGPAVAVSWTPASCPPVVPVVAVADDADVGVGARAVRFQVVSGGEWGAFEYSLDGGPWVPYPSLTVVLGGLALDTNHTLLMRAAAPGSCDTRLAGRRPPPAVVAWDEPPPPPLVAFVEAGPPASTPDVFAEFSLLAPQPQSFLQYRLDAEEVWTPCEALLRVGPLRPGSHEVLVRAVDANGEGSGAPVRHEWAIVSASDSSVVLSGLPDGVHTLVVTAFDQAGSKEVAPEPYSWRVDTQPPTTAANLTTPPFSTARVARVAATCAVEVDPCTFCWESTSVPAGCSSNRTLEFPVEADGRHTVTVTATDSVGLVDPDPPTVEWIVDSTPPVTHVSGVDGALRQAPAGLLDVDFIAGSRRLVLNATANEPTDGFEVTLDGQPWPTGSPPGTTVAGPLEFNGLLSVANRVTVTAVDRAGNKDSTPVSFAVLVDVAAPHTVAITALPTSPTPLSTVSVGVAASDTVGGSGVEAIQVTLGSRVAVVNGSTGTVAFPGLLSGAYNVSVVALDFVGLKSPSPAKSQVVVDLEAPTSEFGRPVPGLVASPNLTVWGATNEPAVLAARVLLGGTSPLPDVPGDASSVALSGLPDGLHTVRLVATDTAGNVEEAPFAEAAVRVDTTPPSLSWGARPPPNTQAPEVLLCVDALDDTEVVVTLDPPAATTLNASCSVFSSTADGVTSVAVTGLDAAGNTGGPITTSWVLDRAPPVTNVTAAVADTPACVTVDGTTVCPTRTSAQMGVECASGGLAAQTSACRVQYVLETLSVQDDACSVGAGRRLAGPVFVDAVGPTVVLGVTSDGLFSVLVRSVDAAGNTEPQNVTMVWHVDSTVPVAAPTFMEAPERTVPSTTALFLMRLEGDSSPGQTRFMYSLDGALEQVVAAVPVPNTATVELQLADLSVASHVLRVWAQDQAGNVGAAETFTWTVVDSAPDVRVEESPAAVSGDENPLFTFVAEWAPGQDRTGVEPLAAIEVSLGDDFATVCEDTNSTAGVCSWRAPLAATGPSTYTLSVRAVFGGVSGDPQTHTWEFLLCEDDAYADVGDNFAISCVDCPLGANCEGGLTAAGELVAVPGFWAPPGVSSSLRFYECPVEDACLAGGEVTVGNETTVVAARCAVGYTGTLCAVCEDGFFEQWGLCVACNMNTGIAWLVTLGVLVGVVGVGVLFFKFRDMMPVDQLKVTLSMAQIIASANTAYAIPWPTMFSAFLNAMRVFLIEAVSLTRASCAQPMTYYSSLVVTLVAFKVVLLVVVLGPVVLHKVKHRRQQAPAPHPPPPPPVDTGASLQRQGSRRSSLTLTMAHAVSAMVHAIDWAKIFKITFLFLFVAYPGVSLKIMKLFKCVEVEGESWLVADMRLRCYDGEWFGYAVYAAVMAGLYTVGLPVAIVIILWRNRNKLGEAGVAAKWGFLYESYGHRAYLWETAELLRKLWLSALVVLMEEGSPLQVTVAVLISGWAHVMHAVYKPWRGIGEGGSYVYALQHGSLFVTSFVFLMGLLFKVEGVSQDGDTYNVLAWAMLLACASFLVAAVMLLVLATRSRLHAAQVARLIAKGRTGKGGVATAGPGAVVAATASRSSRTRRLTRPTTVTAGRDAVDSLVWRINPLTTPTRVEGKSAVNVE